MVTSVCFVFFFISKNECHPQYDSDVFVFVAVPMLIKLTNQQHLMATLFLLASKHIEDPAQHDFGWKLRSVESLLCLFFVVFFVGHCLFWWAPRLNKKI